MADITIQHCTLRVVRHGGWSWGAQPQALVDAAIHALPELLAQRLAMIWPDDAECEITAPIRINVATRISEMVDAAAEMRNALSSGIDSQRSALIRRFDNALKATLERERILNIEEPETINQSIEAKNIENIPLPSHLAQGSNVLRLLFTWREQGVLETRLASFDEISLEAWRRNLLKAAPQISRPSARKISADAVESLVRQLSLTIQGAELDRASILRHRLMIAVEVASSLELSPNDSSIEAPLDRLLPLEDEQVVARAHSTSANDCDVKADLISMQSVASTDAAQSSARSVSARESAQALSRPLLNVDLHVSSALPFLLLGPLARLGYLETLAATLDVAEMENESPLFAAALGYKVLEPIERGWRRNPESVATATVFAGVDKPLPETRLIEFSEKIFKHLAPLDAVLSGSLIEGHTPGQPLLLHRTESAHASGLLLLEAEGLFPVAWAQDAASLLETLRKFGAAPLLIPQSTAEPDLLRQLDDEGISFITDGAPTRGEQWRALRRPPAYRWWTNDKTRGQAELVRAARELQRAAESFAELWQELDVERPSVPLSSNAAFDKHITVAAGIALGAIAWSLWRDSETTAPQLALARFRSLDARVSFDSQRVLVRLPLGRRHQDLSQNGWLKDVSGVPWMCGRVIQFAGG